MLNLLATLFVTALPATPAAFSACPDPMPSAAEMAVGECEQVAPLDLWYRMSRFADGEPGGAAAGPARRLKTDRGVSSCDVPQGPAHVSSPQAPPVALFALPTLLPLHVPSDFDADARDLPARVLAPLERPPRA
jgi:hypothetical protein